MKRYELRTAQEGIAAAPAFRTESSRTVKTDADAPNAEKQLRQAVSRLREELTDAAQKASGNSKDIIEAQVLLLDDPELAGAAFELIRSGLGAAEAVEKAGKALADELSANRSGYIRSRAEDVNGLTAELLRILGSGSGKTLDTPSVLVAEELSPAYFSRLDRSLIRGIVTVKGSEVSHLSILAGSCGIPYVFGSAEAIADIGDGDRLIIDGAALITDPSDEEYQAALKKAELSANKPSEPREPAESCTTGVFANAAGIDDICDAVGHGADGIGLFRTELLFLDRTDEPSEEEQFGIYKKAAELTGGRETVIRTMDIGSDKKAAWLPLPDEINPALGCRGVRVSLENRGVFKKQLRAVMRAGVYGNIKLLVPMIASVWEVDEVSRLISECEEELSREGIPFRVPVLGVMIETPAAVMIADELAEKVGYFSIGTNDLTQYSLAADREAEGLDRYFDPCHESVLRMVGMVCRAARAHGVKVTVCGALAGNEKAVRRLIEEGVDCLSVPVGKLGRTRAAAASAERELKKEKTKHETELVAPADGGLIAMENIPDPAFSSGSLGKCIGVMPENGLIYSPCGGTVTSVAETKHAFTVETENGESILVHVGIDTVKLNGKGFEMKAAAGDTVSAGQLVMQADLDVIRDAGLSPVVIVVRCI